MFCPGGRPPVLSGASGRVTGAATWRSPLTGVVVPVVDASVDTTQYQHLQLTYSHIMQFKFLSIFLSF